MIRFLLLATLLAFGAPAFGDILMLDLNNNRLEVEAAQRAAEARGERLIVIPKIDPYWQKQLDSSRKVVASADVMRGRACRKDGAGTSNCEEANKNYHALVKAHESLEGRVPKMEEEGLTKELAKLKNRGVQISSVIISSHDGDREFWGVAANLDEEMIENAFLKNKPLADNVRSMYLWACYAATTDDFMKSWKRAFPPNVMIAGFGGQSPLGTRPASGHVLEDLLEKEQALTSAHDKNQIKQIFNSLNDINKVNANICTDGETIVSRKGVRTVQDEIEACKRPNSEEQKHVAVFNCYLNADPGCEDMPDDDDHGPLRQAYDFFQEERHCEGVLAELGISKPVPQLLARRLLFDHRVRATFERLYKPELEKFNALLDKLGYPKTLRMRNIGFLTRKQYLDRLREIEHRWVGQMDAVKDANGYVRDPEILAVGKYIEEIQKLDKAGCVGLDWIEDDQEARDSKCGIRTGMDTAMKRAQDEVRSLSTQSVYQARPLFE